MKIQLRSQAKGPPRITEREATRQQFTEQLVQIGMVWMATLEKEKKNLQAI